MKISPLTQGAGNPGQNLGSVHVGRTASPDKMARAKAIAMGQEPLEETGDEQANRVQPNIRSIKMHTQRSPEAMAAEVEPGLEAQPEAMEEPESTISDTNVQATVEDTKPLSPQFAALAKARRDLQVREKQLQEREKALSEKPASNPGEDLVAKLKSQPLSVLREHGVTYDQLTEAILADNGSSEEILALKNELKSMKEGIDKTLSERDQKAEQDALAQMRREAEILSKDEENFEMIRATGSIPQVIKLIHRSWKEHNELLSVSEAMELVENDLVAEAARLAQLKKVQGKLTPTQAVNQPQAQTARPQMKTLTNRDTSTAPLSRKARAMAAFNGTLKR